MRVIIESLLNAYVNVQAYVEQITLYTRLMNN
jgi:hypothetical protein